MKVKFKETATVFPDGEDKPGRTFYAGDEAEIADAYAALLIEKGHVEAAQATAPVEKAARK